MTEGNPRRIYLGSFPSGADVVVIPPGVLDAANARLDAERAAAERKRTAQAADIERARNTRSARVMRRLGKALKMFRRL